MMSLWDALRMNMMISYQELVRTFHSLQDNDQQGQEIIRPSVFIILLNSYFTANVLSSLL